MASESFRISTVMAGLPAQLYAAWLDPERHSEMTGATAEVERGVGGRFTAWDGYIHGTTIELEPERRIVQRWRTSEFPDDAPDSRLEVLFSPEAGGTRVSLAHSGLPAGQGDLYRSGWEEFYFQPMKRWCARHADAESLAALGTDIDNAAVDPRFMALVGPGVRTARARKQRPPTSAKTGGGSGKAKGTAKPKRKIIAEVKPKTRIEGTTAAARGKRSPARKRR
ncbi:MAG: SRPBCC domain-containing protein [Polyangiaceae bacterium]